MKPKNVKERRNSFLKFLLLFIVTVGTIVTAVYFNFKVPKKENDILKEEAKAIKKEMQFQNDFSDEMFNVKKLFDSLDVPGSNTKFTNSLISKKLVDLQGKIPTKDSTYRYDMYTRILTLHVDLQKTKEKLRDLKDAEGLIEEYKEALGKCKDDYTEIQRDMDRLRARLN